MSKNILVPGGAGFIGSHTVNAIANAGYTPIVLDNLVNGHRDAVERYTFIEGDIRDQNLLENIFSTYNIEAVVHFAAFIEAGESVVAPLKFYDNNTAGSLSLLSAMQRNAVDKIVFSSTAAVYGQPISDAAIAETDAKAPINPYGQSKWATECMLADSAAAWGLNSIALRYFNAAGASPDGSLGERHDPETHLIPLVLQAAMGTRTSIKIFGTDYDTPDGTCIRDYIHVCDLADAHVKALDHLFATAQETGAYQAINLGNGAGFSVREVIDTVRAVTSVDFQVDEVNRRAGDPAVLVANANKAKDILNWVPSHPHLKDMVLHAWNFMKGQN